MRTFFAIFLIIFGLGLVSCERDRETNRREAPNAREAGRQAYRASQDLKRGVQNAEKDLEKATREFREGWNEAKHQEPPKTRHEGSASREEQ